MKRYKLLSILIAFILLWSGCSTGGKQTVGKALPKEDHATEITIEVQDYGANFYANAATKFEKETGVKVNVINDFNGQSNEDMSSFWSANEERIQTELMAGKGADLYAGIFLDFAALGKNKHLCNLANWVADEPVFSDDTYYMNVLKSEINEGNVYSVPLLMFFSALGSTIEVPELYGKTLNWEEFFELTKGTKRSGVLYGNTDFELFIRRFNERNDNFVNEENKTQSLNSPDMIKLLEQCKKWSTEGLCIQYDAADFNKKYDNSFFKLPGGGDMDMLTNFRYDNPHEKNGYYYYDIPSDSGKNDKANKVSPTDLICINAATPYKGTAWKFVKFLLSEEIQVDSLFTPLNRKAADKHINKSLNERISYFGLKVDANKIIKESEAILDNVDKVSTNVNSTDIQKIVFSEAKRFFKNEISADTAAKNMADRVALYFKEQ